MLYDMLLPSSRVSVQTGPFFYDTEGNAGISGLVPGHVPMVSTHRRGEHRSNPRNDEWKSMSNYERAYFVLRTTGELRYDPKTDSLNGRALDSIDHFASYTEILNAAKTVATREGKARLTVEDMPRSIRDEIERARDDTSILYVLATRLAQNGNHR